MCSVIGYLGSRDAAPILVKGLQRMEYRGYDSAGIATLARDRILVRKGVGRVDEVNTTFHLDSLPGHIGAGHTRWATHGGVNEVNAHPHPSSSGKIAIVHNGIIDNHQELREDLERSGYLFRSQTDSEVIANLLQRNYDGAKNVKEAMLSTVKELKGNYSFIAIFEEGTLAAARFHEPLVVGLCKEGYFISSDILGFVDFTDKVIYLDNRDVVLLKNDGVHVCNFAGAPVGRQIIKISNEMADAEKGDYVHHTLKEIFEQPTTILKAGERTESEITQVAEMIGRSKNVYITGSGTSFHAALVAKYLFAKFAKIRSETIISSEAEFSPVYFDQDSLLIALSQSGESADVLEAVNIAKEKGAKIVSVVNVTTSSLARLSSVSIGLNCGPEIGVAATKSFTSQLAVLYKITDRLCEDCIGLSFDEVSTQISGLLSDHSAIKELTKKIRDATDIYILGRGIHYCIASEASLKLKELAYIHAEALPGGELKHGPLALIDPNSYVIMINPSDSTYTNALASAHEVKARGAKIIGVSDKPSETYDYWIRLPRVDRNLFPLLETIPMQLLSYYLALEKNTNPDFPRNLAKSVTVK